MEMFKLKLVKINEDRTLTYEVYQYNMVKLLSDLLFLLFTFGTGLILIIDNGDYVGYDYLCTLTTTSKSKAVKYLEAKFD